jgi:DNA processing protein
MNYSAYLAYFPKITYQRHKRLLSFFSNKKNIAEAELDEFTKAGWEASIAVEFISWREQNPMEKYDEELTKQNIKTVSLGETNYPSLLAEINDPPQTIFYRGTLNTESRPALAVVGTRRYTTYGKHVCEKIVGPLAQQGMLIISGLALGIDGIAHQTALNNHGKTIAVLGSGIDPAHIYPATHRQLAEKIISSGGAIISEYPPNFEPTQYSFPARNRIIAGLSLGTLVVEAAEVSGALITAKCALDYNREVFGIPHAITSNTGAGVNNLIKLGAKVVTTSADITEALNLKNLKEIVSNRQILPSSPTESSILAVLSREPKHIDFIIKETGLDSQTINGTLTLMEMKGMVKNIGNMTYIIVN